jgi:polyisoprenoid-binding protein YceI
MRTALFLGFLAFAPVAAAEGSGLQRSGAAEVVFTGKGPGGFRIEGKTNELAFQETADGYTFTVPLAKLDTGIALRNKHMREKYLEVEKYPDAVLVVPRKALTLPEDGKSSNGTVEGDLTIHGKSRRIPVRYSVHRKGGAYEVSGQFGVDLRHHGIASPSYMGMTVKPEIDATVSFALRQP